MTSNEIHLNGLTYIEGQEEIALAFFKEELLEEPDPEMQALLKEAIAFLQRRIEKERQTESNPREVLFPV